MAGLRLVDLRSRFCEFGPVDDGSSFLLPRPIKFLSRPIVPSVLVPF